MDRFYPELPTQNDLNNRSSIAPSRAVPAEDEVDGDLIVSEFDFKIYLRDTPPTVDARGRIARARGIWAIKLRNTAAVTDMDDNGKFPDDIDDVDDTEDTDVKITLGEDFRVRSATDYGCLDGKKAFSEKLLEIMAEA